MSEIFEPTSLQVYTTAEELAALYQRNTARIMAAVTELRTAIDELSEGFSNSYAFSCDVKIANADRAEDIPREMKRAAWFVLIQKMGIRNVMGIADCKELDEALNPNGRRHYRNGEDPIDKLPEISADAIRDVASGYAASAGEFLDKSIHEVYKFLKPWNSDTRKTNRKNRWRLSRKVIIPYGVEERYSESGNFRVSYNSQAQIQGIDTAMHLLDGKWIPKGNCGPLVDTIAGCNTPGERLETEYFLIRCFKNRTLHLTFKRMDLVDEINLRCGNNWQLPGSETDDEWSGGTDGSDSGPVGPDGDFNFYQTPEALAERICDLAQIGRGHDILEPSAGAGRLAIAARERGANVECVEIQPALIRELSAMGFPVIGDNFLAMTTSARKYDAVIMNPPFCRSQDVRHIRHAWGFLREGGVMVSVASAGVKYRGDRMTVEFRKWLESVGGEIIDLPEQSFADSGTDVNTVLIVAYKPVVHSLF